VHSYKVCWYLICSLQPRWLLRRRVDSKSCLQVEVGKACVEIKNLKLALPLFSSLRRNAQMETAGMDRNFSGNFRNGSHFFGIRIIYWTPSPNPMLLLSVRSTVWLCGHSPLLHSNDTLTCFELNDHFVVVVWCAVAAGLCTTESGRFRTCQTLPMSSQLVVAYAWILSTVVICSVDIYKNVFVKLVKNI